MSLSAGTRLGPYEIEAPLGAGGMGEVYRARDARLDRIVAIKVLLAQLAGDAELRQRFEREARAVSSLNHPHICTLYDIGHQDGADFLVMEYLEGETLAARLARGPLPLKQVLEFGIQMADALAHAHRQGVFHRDLNPGNVMLARSGAQTVAKLLDFGLAKMAMGGQKAAALSLSAMSTQIENLTQKGSLLGTLQYMAPEQLEGRGSDAPADIFAFGAVLYEMATGRKAFPGKSQASVIAAILDSDPPPVSSLQPMSPPALDQAVKNCLAKNPEQRWQTAHDLKLELQSIAETPAAPTPSRAATSASRLWIAAALVLLLVTIGLSIAYFHRPAAESPAMRFSVPAPEKSTFAFSSIPLLSPDGRRLAFGATGAAGRALLWVRPLDSLTAQPLPGTDGAFRPFWSPDSRFLGYFQQNKLKKIEISGGPPQTLCDAPGGLDGAWNREGIILFAMRGQPLHRVSDAGGPVTAVTTLDASRQELSHVSPEFLADARHFLYSVTSRMGQRDVCVGSLDAKPGAAPKRLGLRAGPVFRCAYAPSSENPSKGHLLFMREITLMAQPFDAARLELSGDPFPIAEQVYVAQGAGAFSVSRNGVLAYTSGSGQGDSQLKWFDRAGKTLGVVGAPATYSDVTLSPDQSRAAAEIVAPSRGVSGDIWVVDLARNISSRLTFAPGYNYLPVWAPDSSRILFTANREGAFHLYQKIASGAGNEEEVLAPQGAIFSQDWSSDGRYLVYAAFDPKTLADLWVLPLTAPPADRKPVPYLQTPFNESYAQFSPDVRWMAYVSDESGVQQVYVQSFPASGGKWLVSSGGGSQPRWRRDGKELFYIAPDGKLMAVSVKTGPGGAPAFGLPQELFQTRLGGISTNVVFLYAVAAGGQRFLINTALEETASSPPITIVLNWTAGVKR